MSSLNFDQFEIENSLLNENQSTGEQQQHKVIEDEQQQKLSNDENTVPSFKGFVFFYL